MPRNFRNSNETLETYQQKNETSTLQRTVNLKWDRRFTLPEHWYAKDFEDPDPSSFHNIQFVRLSPDDDPDDPPVITAHWEGYGYDILNPDPNVFSNFQIERDFTSKRYIRDFNPAVKHLICQTRGYNRFMDLKDEDNAAELAQRTLDICRRRNELPDIEFETEKKIK